MVIIIMGCYKNGLRVQNCNVSGCSCTVILPSVITMMGGKETLLLFLLKDKNNSYMYKLESQCHTIIIGTSKANSNIYDNVSNDYINSIYNKN